MDIEQHIDPELRAVLKQLPENPACMEELIAFRKMMGEFIATPDQIMIREGGVTIEERNIPGSKGAPDVPVIIFSPSGKPQNAPGLLYIHGGGFIMCNAKMFSADCERIVENAGCVIMSVDYRLAPENPFPAALDDCYAALRWMFASAQKLGVDPARIAIGGESAGAGLAAAVALMARDRKEFKLVFQLLLSACLDDRHITPSSRAITDRRVWNRSSSLFAWKSYLGSKHSGEVSPYAAPARAKDLSGLPPAYIMTSELDLLRDENVKYAMRLSQAGVSTELHVFSSAFHGLEQFPPAAIAKRAISEYIDALKRAFSR
jgi:acetyl esterase/lipase